MTKRNGVRPRHVRGARTNDVTSRGSKSSADQASLGGTRNKEYGDVSNTCYCGYDSCVPRWLPWCVVFVTMTSRIWYVTSDNSLWILHPDETFQSIEVAFSEVYGYGFRPYEYLPPPVNVTSSADNQTLTSGMYALRSFLYPQIFSLLLRLAHLLGADQHPFMICRVFNVIITSLLPLSVHMFTMRVFSCRLLALLSCAFSSLQLHLAVFATHTIVNSFTSPFVFFGLSMCLPVSYSKTCIYFQRESTKTIYRAHRKLHEQQPEVNSTRSKLVSEHESSSGYSSTSSNDRSPSETKAKKLFRFDNINYETNNNKPSDQITRTNSQTTCKPTVCSLTRNDFLQAFWSGLLLGLVCYVRVDTVLICATLHCSIVLTNVGEIWASMTLSFISALGGLVGLSSGAIYDVIQYGDNVISPVQWFKFNILSNKAQTLYASLDSIKYWHEFLSTPFCIVTTMFIIVCNAYVCLYNMSLLPKFHLRRYCAISVSLIFITVVYSCGGHSELRFIHNVFVLYAICGAMSLHLVFIIFSKHLNRNFSIGIICLVLAIHGVDTWSNFPDAKSRDIDRWTYGKASVSRDLNVCLRRLSQTNDVTGVFIDSDLYNIAGFASLKHDIPVLVKVYNELHLYHARKPNSFGLSSSIRVVNDFSDMFHKTNTAYLSKLLLEEHAINYILTRRKPPFINVKGFEFDQVQTCGEQFKIYHRDLDARQTRAMHRAAKEHPVGLSTSVLTYEGNWLITRGLYHKAIKRLEAALQLETPTIRLYQQLLFCFFKLGQTREVIRYEKECVHRFGQEECAKPQPKIVLHDEYRRFDM